MRKYFQRFVSKIQFNGVLSISIERKIGKISLKILMLSTSKFSFQFCFFDSLDGESSPLVAVVVPLSTFFDGTSGTGQSFVRSISSTNFF